MIEHRESPQALADLTEADRTGGFFEGWPHPPTPSLHLAHLRGAEVAVLGVDTRLDGIGWRRWPALRS